MIIDHESVQPIGINNKDKPPLALGVYKYGPRAYHGGEDNHAPPLGMKNGTDIFRPYSKPNSFRGVEICPYPSPDIQHLIPYSYPNTQIVYL